MIKTLLLLPGFLCCSMLAFARAYNNKMLFVIDSIPVTPEDFALIPQQEQEMICNDLLLANEVGESDYFVHKYEQPDIFYSKIFLMQCQNINI